MSLQLNVSNSLKDLSAQLATDLMNQGGSVFQKQWIVTQTDGMNNWLTIELANKMGINANCRFARPNDVVTQLFYWLDGESKKVLGAGHLQWLIYNLLNDAEFIERFTTISSYYQGDDVKRIALAGKLADLFDQYQVYRPEMVDEWNGAFTRDAGNEAWQKYLWIKIKEKIGRDLTDKTNVIRSIIQQLDDPARQERLFARLPQIHLFGLSIITKLHIDLFNQLSKYIAVNFYLLNPAPLVYWLDDKTEKQIARMALAQKKAGRPIQRLEETGNTLLISWGKVIQDSFALLFENEDFLNVYNDSTVAEPEPGEQDSLLKKLQRDIFYNHDANGRNVLTEADIRDESLTINACYTPLREVESLYNYLVHLVDQKREQLSPRDIVVMVSDIDAYAPYIKAIFNTAIYKFPYTVADESFQSGDSLLAAARSILLLSQDSFKAEEVMELLDSKYIRERFNITDTALTRKVVSMANIRFGIEGSREDDTMLVSWNMGMQRIMYGICMSGSTEYDTGQDIIYPLDMAEGAEAMELIRFCHFIEVLKWYVNDRTNNRTLAGWGQYIQQLVNDLVFQPEANEAEEDYQRLLAHIENLNILTGVYDEPVSFEVFKHSFIDILNTETRSGSFATSGITFCSLIPMRSIPFKVVALLGMNFDKFPRKEIPLSFNLMAQRQRRGDRNIKENDKHLFLETLLSAQGYLYISFIGRNAKDNSIQPPSALVDELVDYVDSGIKDAAVKVRDILITTQPLHGFSQKYFDQTSGLYSYLGWNGSDRVMQDQQGFAAKENKLFPCDEIDVSGLLAFFKNPLKWYYNKVLGIYYNEEEVLLPDTELFELDKLQEWKLKTDLLYLDEAILEAYRTKALNTGALPLKHMADIQINNILEEVAPVKKLLLQCVGNSTRQEVLIDIPLDSTVISGKLKDVYGDKAIMISFSKNHYKYLLEAYIRYVVATAQGLHLELNYVSAKKKSIFTIPRNTYTQSEALSILNQLAEWYRQGHAEIFLFYPGFNESPMKYATFDGVKLNSLIAKFLDKNPDEYLQKEYDNGMFANVEAVNTFVKNTITIFSPVAELFRELIS